MTALVQAISRLSAGTNTEIETLEMLAIFSGAGLLISLLCASYGLWQGFEPEIFLIQ